ncbi:MAG: hypothetical protein ABIJ31_13860 [Pseudomonadota bacterium]
MRLRIFLACLVFFGYGLPAICGPTKLIPSISVREEYNDNVLLTQTNEKKSLITVVAGGIYVEKLLERLESRADINIKKLMYKGFHELDSVDKDLSIGLDYRMTERLTLGASGSWATDSTRGNDIDTTGLALTGDRDSKNVSLSSGYLITEINRINLSLDIGRTSIKAVSEDEKDQTVRLSLDYSHNLSKIWENTTGFVGLSYLKYTSDITDFNTGSFIVTDIDKEYASNVWQATFGFSREMTERLTFSFQTGISYNDTQERLRQNTIFGSELSLYDTDSLGSVLYVGINYKGLNYDAGFSVSRDVRDGAGTNGTAERTSASFELLWQFTDRFTATLKPACYLNQNERNTSADLDELTISLQSGFRYKITDDISLAGGYRFTHIDDQQNDTSKQGNLVFFKVTKQFIYDID